MRSLVVMALCAVLAGCGIYRQTDQQEAVDPALDSANEALAQCRDAYPDEIAQAVARAACVNKATELLRPLLLFPDLLDQENALRKSLAEQVQTKNLSLLERNRQITKFHAKMLAEEQSRLLANPSEAAKVFSAAVTQWRMSNPDSCTMLGGNTRNCY
jgi:hypothetical protein